ncbi:OmpA family protein [Inquilinus sp. Marseille-Q2685]|uniref:OmpA family protein n=1 Tax=Inquilinus sp. Marseille-Q2685 TaxID=2866581 RepID=UPI001CE3D70D|nr:OmpA family protein [Inquilinus sp. Marseille-Q2685]
MNSVIGTIGRIAALALALAAVVTAPAVAADIKGAKDYPGIKRFDGASIVVYSAQKFTHYTLPLGPADDADDDNKPVFAASKQASGALTRLSYTVPAGISSDDVFENYENELAAKGYQILFKADGGAIGKRQDAIFSGIGTQLFDYSPEAAHLLTAELAKDGATVDVVLYVTEYEDGYTPGIEVEKGQVIVQLDVIESGTLQDKMVTVSAAEIEKGLTAQGHIALYGITFDFAKADLKPDSKPALDQVAQFLKDDPAAKIHVVGHTDNVGGLETNMALSRARAAAVVAALVKQYGVSAGRLNPAGVGPLAPVAPNDSDDGRARNRRVELIPQ